MKNEYWGQADDMFFGAVPIIFVRAKYLKQDMAHAESIVWERVSKKQLGVKFRRQHPIANYIADFYCHSAKLVVEIDGGVHQLPENVQYDIARQEDIEFCNIKVIRFSNYQVFKDIEHVITEIKKHLPDSKTS